MAQTKIHGFVSTPDQSLTGGLPMLQVTTTTDLVTLAPADPNGVAVPASGDFAAYQDHGHNAALDALIKAVSLRAQPIIMGIPVNTSGTFTFRFAVEHLDIYGDILMADGVTQNVANDTVVAVRAALGDTAATIKPFVL